MGNPVELKGNFKKIKKFTLTIWIVVTAHYHFMYISYMKISYICIPTSYKRGSCTKFSSTTELFNERSFKIQIFKSTFIIFKIFY